MTTKQIRLSDLPGAATLELHDCEIIANAINVFGSGDHPMAHAQKNLNGFDLDYLLECLDKGIDMATSEEFKEEVTDLYINIHCAKEDEEGAREVKRQVTREKTRRLMKQFSNDEMERVEALLFYTVDQCGVSIRDYVICDIENQIDFDRQDMDWVGDVFGARC